MRTPHHYPRLSDLVAAGITISGGDGPTDGPDEELQGLLAEAAEPAEVDDERLPELREELEAAGNAAVDAGDFEQAEAILELIEALDAEVDTRREQDEADQERAEELRSRMRAVDDDDGDDGEPDEGDDLEDAADDDTEATAEDEEGDEGGTEADVEEASAEDTAEPVAASNRAGRRRNARAKAKANVKVHGARRPPGTGHINPRPDAETAAAALPDIGEWGLVAAANAPDMAAGAPIRDAGQLADTFLSAWRATQGYTGHARVKAPVVRMGGDPRDMYGDDRFLDAHDAAGNARKIAAVASPAAIVASGGVCAPTEVRYDLPVWGSERRPVRDEALVRFGASRGGVRVLPIPVIEDVAGAITEWPEATDATPGANTKACLSITCPTEVEQKVDAVVKCLETGNFRANYFPEQIEAWMRLAAVNHARTAEQRLIDKVEAQSTAVTTGDDILSATRDLAAILDRACAAMVSRHRLEPGLMLDLMAPFWLNNMIRTDLARQLPGGGTINDETLAVADATIARIFAARNINPIWMLDGESGQQFTVQGVNALQGYPDTVVCYLFPRGSHLFLDGGELDLGVVRDSTLNSTNDFQMFSETFEGHVFHGIESWELTMDIAATGATAATVDTTSFELSGS